MTEFLTALALAIVIEGIVYAAFPDQMKRALALLLDTPSSTMRVTALTIAIGGFILLWLVRSFG